MTRGLIKNEPVGVEFISGNAGTYDYMNPTVRLYQMHSDYHVPLDFSIYRTDIELSNSSDNFVMERWFDFLREFPIPDLSPRSHATLSEQLLTN